MTKAFEGMSSASLRAIAQALRAGQLGNPISKLALKRIAPSCTEAGVDELTRLSADGIKPAHLALLVDAVADTVEARLSLGAELVWTGPETPVAHSRDTAVVLAELFASARRSIIVSTFVVHQPRAVFRALAERMAQVPELKVQLFVHVGRNKHDTRQEFGDLERVRSRASGWLARRQSADALLRPSVAVFERH